MSSDPVVITGTAIEQINNISPILLCHIWVPAQRHGSAAAVSRPLDSFVGGGFVGSPH
jgi:hypothetical protein